MKIRWNAEEKKTFHGARGMVELFASALLACALVAAPVALSGCGSSGGDQASAPAVAETAAATDGTVSQWRPGTAPSGETEQVAKNLAAAIEAGTVADSIPIPEGGYWEGIGYAADATLDNWVTGEHIAGVEGIAGAYRDWALHLTWTKPEVYVASVLDGEPCGVAVLETVVTDASRSPVALIPCLDVIAVSNGKIVHEEIFGDPHLGDVVKTRGPTPCPLCGGYFHVDVATAERWATWASVARCAGDWQALMPLYGRDAVFLDTSQAGVFADVGAWGGVGWLRDTGIGADADSLLKQGRPVKCMKLVCEPPIVGATSRNGVSWALVRWMASETDFDGNELSSVPGATMMEFRAGEPGEDGIARETVYYNSQTLRLIESE